MVTNAAAAASKRHVLDRYRHLREDHLRYMERCGLVRPTLTDGSILFSFSDLGLLRQVESEMASGVPFRRVMRGLIAAQAGQLAFDFRHDSLPAKVLRLTRRTMVKPSTRGSERSTMSSAGIPRRVNSCTASSPSRTTTVSRRRLSVATRRNAAARVTLEIAMSAYGAVGGMTLSAQRPRNTASHYRIRRETSNPESGAANSCAGSYTVTQFAKAWREKFWLKRRLLALA